MMQTKLSLNFCWKKLQIAASSSKQYNFTILGRGLTFISILFINAGSGRRGGRTAVKTSSESDSSSDPDYRFHLFINYNCTISKSKLLYITVDPKSFDY